jgi:hypothetical protein
MDAQKSCRMCISVYPEVPCPECGACFQCASDDCAFCVERLKFLRQEQERAARADDENGG